MKTITPKIVLFIILTCTLSNLHAQNELSISGTVRDTSRQYIIGATVLLIQSQDTIPCITNDQGYFSFKNIQRIKFTLRISALGYDLWEYIVDSTINKSQVYLPDIILSYKSNILKEVVIKGKINPMSLNGDTIEYKVDQYNMKANSVVEDLMKKLPGLEVTSNGSISFMGRPITSIRLNGTDFPVPNIQSLTQLVPTDILDKVQIIEDYGTLSRLTGRKSGKSIPIINLQTKSDFEGSKQLRVNSGLGDNNRHSLSSTILLLNPSERKYLQWNYNNVDNLSNGDANTNQLFLAYFKKNSKLNIQTNGTLLNTHSISKTYQSIKTLTNQGNQFNDNQIDDKTNKNIYNLIISGDHKSLNKSITFSIKNEVSNEKNFSSSLSNQYGLQTLNQSYSNNNLLNLYSLDQEINFIYQFKKKGRILNISERLGFHNTNENLINDNYIEYYYTDKPEFDSLLNQSIKKQIFDFQYFTQFSFIEPVNKNSDFEFAYNIQYSKNTNNIKTYFQDQEQKLIFVDSLSTNSTYRVIKHNLSATYRYNSAKTDVTISNNFSSYLINASTMTGVPYSKKAIIFTPNFRLQVKTSNSSVLIASVTNNVIFPDYQQIQSVPDKTNIQYPIMGNPTLKVQNTYQANIEYRYTGNNIIFLTIRPELTSNKIVTNLIVKTDSIGNIFQETHYLNSNGNYTVTINGGYSRQLLKNKIGLFYDNEYSLGHSIFFLDNIKKESRINKITQSVKVNINTNWIEISPIISHSYTKNLYIINTNSSTDFNQFDLELNAKLFFLKSWKMEINSRKQIFSGFNSSISSNPLIIYATLEKKIYKDQIVFRIQGFNLINERDAISQYINGNTIIQTKNNTIGRFFLFSMIADLKKIKRKQ